MATATPVLAKRSRPVISDAALDEFMLRHRIGLAGDGFGPTHDTQANPCGICRATTRDDQRAAALSFYRFMKQEAATKGRPFPTIAKAFPTPARVRPASKAMVAAMDEIARILARVPASQRQPLTTLDREDGLVVRVVAWDAGEVTARREAASPSSRRLTQ